MTYVELEGGRYDGRRITHPTHVLSVTGTDNGVQWVYGPTGRTTADNRHIFAVVSAKVVTA